MSTRGRVRSPDPCATQNNRKTVRSRMRCTAVTNIALMPGTPLAADPLPHHPDFNNYQMLLSHSPFAIASVVPTMTENFPRDLYLASVACSENGAVVTLASDTNKNFKEVVSSERPNEHGFIIQFGDIRCGDQK